MGSISYGGRSPVEAVPSAGPMADEITPIPLRPWSRDRGVDGGGQSFEHGFGEGRLRPWDVDTMGLC